MEMGVTNFRKGKGSVDDRPELLLLHQPQDPKEARLWSHRGSQDLLLFDEEMKKIDLDLRAGRCSAGDEPPAERQGLEALLPGGGADVLEDDIDAAPVREFPDLVRDLLFVVIDDVIG